MAHLPACSWTVITHVVQNVASVTLAYTSQGQSVATITHSSHRVDGNHSHEMYNSHSDQLEWPPLSPLLADAPLPSPPPSQHTSLSFSHVSHFPPLLSPTPVSPGLTVPLPRSPPPSSSSSTAYADERLSHFSPQPLSALDTFNPASVPAATLLSAASCLAFDPQQALERLTALAQPTSPVSTEPRRRQRIPGLTKQQRTERKKQKHREIDAIRRHREHAVVLKMQSLMEGSNGPHGSRQHKRARGAAEEAAEHNSDDSSDEEGGEDGSSTTKRPADKMDKASVMERAAEHMERMQAVLQQMAAACTKQQQHLRTFLEHQQRLSATASTSATASPPHPLSTLHPYASQRLYAHVGSVTLDSAGAMSDSSAIMVVSLATGCFLHANGRFLSMTGWQPSHLIGRLMMPPPHSFVHQRVMPALPNSYLVDGPDGRMQEACFFDQHERSKQLMGLLLAGQLRSVTAVWRFLLKDSRLYDVEGTSWLGYQDIPMQPGKQQPAYAVFVSHLDRRVSVSLNTILKPQYSQ